MAEAPPFAVLKHLGEGGYGTVDLVQHDQFGKVAYKTCKGASTDKRIQDKLREEADRHMKLRHPNIVILYEAVFRSNFCGIFMEYMSYGAVDTFLEQFDVPPEWRIRIIYETALAMSYLHGQKPAIIHGDLSSKNILIGDEFHAKVADFGLACTIKENYSSSITETPLCGKLSFIAPEYWIDPKKRKSEKFDVYSFAILSWEIFSKKEAYYDFSDRRLVGVFVEKGERPKLEDIGSAIPTNIKTLIQNCWDGEEDERPTFKFIKDDLFVNISQLQRELRRAYSVLIEQNKILCRSNSTEACDFSDSLGVPSVDDFRRESRLANSMKATGQILTVRCVMEITSSNDELYVVSRRDIDVYDIDTLVHRRKITVDGLKWAWDIVAHANVLYVSESKAELIHGIQLSDETSSHWSVKGSRLKLSINKRGNVVVSCYNQNKIIEFTPFGECVHEIELNISQIVFEDSDSEPICRLLHAIQLDDDQFLTGHATLYGDCICLFNKNGCLMKRYGERGTGQELNRPRYFAIDHLGFILVADNHHDRIIQFSASLEFIRELIPASAGLKNPWRMHFNERKRRLFVAQRIENIVKIFDL